MINFTSRSFIPAAQSPPKVAPGTDAPTDSSKAATAAPAANQGGAKSSGNPSFQSLLNAQSDGGNAALPQNPVLPELAGQLSGDEDTVQSAVAGGRGRTSAKSEVPAAAAPAQVDIASLIGAATGQPMQAAQVNAPRLAESTPPTVTGATTAKTSLAAALAAGVEVSAHAADATTERAPADNETTPVGGVTAIPGESGAKPQPTVDATALAVTRQNASDADAAPLVSPIRLERLDTAFATQNVTLPHIAMPAVTDNHAPPVPAVASGISTPVGAEGWDQALGQRVVWMVAQRNPTAEIHVNPPNLGPLSVTVNVDNNTANATFVAAHAATRDAINDALPRLKEMLADSGIALGQVTVSAESFSHGGGSGAQQAYVPREHGVSGAPAPGAAGPLVSPVRTSSAPIGLVDTFA